jgi:hypothetical protein
MRHEFRGLLERAVATRRGTRESISWDRFWAGVWSVLQLAALPFTELRGLLRALVSRLIALRLSNR